MKDLKTILEECSINDIYFSNRGTSILYKIPIYQRNYAWEREEIRALINDVYDSMTKSVYYIGTLVTYKRDENIWRTRQTLWGGRTDASPKLLLYDT